MSLDNIRIVLVRPLFGGNLGSICRAMKNMSLSKLCLVQPSSSLDYFEARKMAMHAADILDGRQEFGTLAEAVHDCALVAATTARQGLYRNHARSAREWAPVLIEAAGPSPVAVVFGTEDSGLSNEELALATQVIRIPSSREYQSINLAQAVMICCYELYLADGNYDRPKERHRNASIVMRERMFAMWREMLRDIGFFDEEKEEHMMMGFRRIFSRSTLTESDVNILMGVARQAQWCAGRMPSNQPVKLKEIKDDL